MKTCSLLFGLKVLLFLFLLSLKAKSQINIIPLPKAVEVGDGLFQFNSMTEIRVTAESKLSGLKMQEQLKQEYQYNLKVTEKCKPYNNAIYFKHDKDLPDEGYILNISKSIIQISASTNIGWFYGTQSFMQLLKQYSIPNEKRFVEIPVLKITDEPRFKWRGFMLDEARYFKGMDQVKLLLDEMSHLKMNVFHWHLTDDQGWRIEIKKYPLLTKIGSKRKSTQIGPGKWWSPIQSAEPHEGYYTQQEIKEIIKYAAERHITIIPEIEMPGHASAAIASYPWLGTIKSEIEVPIQFGVSKNVFDITDPRVYDFLTDVLDEVVELFPSEIIHIGGDEIKYEQWKESNSVKAYMDENNVATPADLQIHFINRISKYLESKGRKMMGWNEVLGHNLHEYQDSLDTETEMELAKATIVNFWKGDSILILNAAKKGYEIVNSTHSFTYLDYDYATISLEKAYLFDPLPYGLPKEDINAVTGLTCHMWGEWIPTIGELHFQTFPRIAAYAEVGWTVKARKNYEEFKNALEHLKKRWDCKMIYYAPDHVVY